MKILQAVLLSLAVLFVGNVASAGCPGGQCKVGAKVRKPRAKVKKLRAKGRKAARAVRLAVPWSMG